MPALASSRPDVMRPPFLIAAIALVMIGSQPAPGRSLEIFQAVAHERPTFSSRSELVVLHLTVKGSRGAYVSDLPLEAFHLFEDGQPQSISFFTKQDAPVTVGLVLDSSGSMQAIADLVITAGVAFAETSNPQDDLFVLGFNEYVRATLPPGAPFTQDIPTFREALARAITARGKTALYDAVAAGLEYLDKGKFERKVLVVVSDGGDNASHRSFAQAITETQTSNAVIYTVGLIDPVDREANPGRLRRIAEASGGEAFFPRRAAEVTDVLRHIARDIRNSYTLGYMSTNPTLDGAVRAIRVEVRLPGRRGRVEVRTRKGYVAGSAGAERHQHAP